MIHFKMNNFKTQGHHCAYTLFTPLPAMLHHDTHVSVLEKSAVSTLPLF